jgi:hypothetical protein
MMNVQKRISLKLTVQDCGTGSAHTVSPICSEAKVSVRQKGLPIFTSPGKKHNMQKRVDDFGKDVLRRTIFGFYSQSKETRSLIER